MRSLRIRSRFTVPALWLSLCFVAPGALGNPAGNEVSLLPHAVTPESLLRDNQRQVYLKARDALSQRQMTRYRELLGQLADYPLTPYLTYRELTRNLHQASPDSVQAFLEAESGSYLAHQLQRQWLHALARQERWDQYLADYSSELHSSELQCYALHARLKRDDLSALDEVEPLWNVAHSQPEACDPVFDRWVAAKRLTPAIAWERHTKAVKAGQYGLANYLARQMPEAWQQQARLLRDVNRNPQLLTQTQRFREQSEAMQDIISHGLQRLARRDAPQALALWRGYDAQQLFSDPERLATQETIAQRLIFQGHRDQADRLLATVPALNSTELVESVIRDALEQLDWERAYTWLNQLPAADQDSERWRYWRARMIEELELENTGPEPKDLYAAVAATRSFYGFLSADKLGFEYRLLDQPAPVTDAVLADIEQHPALQRAYEHLMIGDTIAASREWFHTVPKLEHEQIMAAGKLAQRWGWHRKGIQAMISARFWDDLQMRFPLAYQEHVQTAARETSVHPHLLFAIARQESAFMPHARSPAGAMGLMQLMPATAQQTARRAGVPYRRADLLSPEKNIALGSRYLNELLTEFNGNRILAAAAYNAGPYRVKQWLREKEHSLPYDVWIETIPFRETRGYVQNVLSYSVIYGYRMGEQGPFITPEEARTAF